MAVVFLAVAYKLVVSLLLTVATLAILNRIRYWLTPRPPATSNSGKRKLTVTFIHPDLGIGGAERLILDAALAIQKHGGHQTRIVTNFFDPQRCFHDAKSLEVIVAGASFCPRHIFGKGHVLFASIRMFLASVWASMALSDTDVFIVDQVSLAMVPLRFFTPRPVLFYCHFPDQLCDGTRFTTTPTNNSSQKEVSTVRSLYRAVFDNIEAATMHFATKIVCNSEFTLGVTLELFPSLKSKLPRDRDTSVLNPPVDVNGLVNGKASLPTAASSSSDDNNSINTTRLEELADCFTVLSINRYERKKNINLAVEAFAEFKKNLIASTPGGEAKLPFKPKLVHAGGYDERLPENRDHYAELVDLAKKLGVSDDVIFLRSISDETKRMLVREIAAVLIYTPTNEHFGIVPVEAMACGKPVLAVNRGGPIESVGTDGQCGILNEPEPGAFAKSLAELYDLGAVKRQQMGERGKQRVGKLFALDSFGDKLCKIIESLL